jgi:hypothetical protein
MEIIKFDACGYYYYKPDFEVKNYSDTCETKNEKDCIICKRSLYEPSYDQITDNTKLLNEQDIIIGKCGHCYHHDCMQKWLNAGNKNCPIDKVEWHTHRVADSMTKLVLFNNKKYFNDGSTPNNLKRYIRKNKNK